MRTRPSGVRSDPFYPLNRRQSCPFQYTNGVENRIGIEDPAAGLVSLAAVQISTPALMFRQAQRCQTLLRAVAMRMLSAGRQLRLVEAGKIEQGAINVALGGLHVLTSTASLLPPGIERGLTLSRRAIGFIRHDNICRGELVAEIVVD